MSGSLPDGGLARPGPVSWPLLSGLIPQLADSHIPRHETGLGLASSLAPGDTAVLIPSDAAGRSLGGVGGTGKTQLALAGAHTLWGRQAPGLVVLLFPPPTGAAVVGYAAAHGGPRAAAPAGPAGNAATPPPCS